MTVYSYAQNQQDELWLHESVRLEELPSLQDVLCTCDREALERVFAEECRVRCLREAVRWRSGIDCGKDSTFQDMERRFSVALEVMCSIEVPEAGNDMRVLLPLETFELGLFDRVTLRSFSAALVDMDKVFEVACVQKQLLSDQVDATDVRDSYRRLAEADLGIRGACCFGQMPWDEILSTRIWMHASLCLKERYLMLANIVREVARVGCDDIWPDDPYGLSGSDCFEREYRTQRRTFVEKENRRAFLGLLEGQLNVARRLGLAD